MTDFERCLRNFLSSAFPSAIVDCCLFHFCQAVVKWVQNKERREHAPATGRYKPSQVWVRILKHLALLPVDDVTSTFNHLTGEIPSGLDDSLSYFSSTWVQVFSAGRSARLPPQLWNALDKISVSSRLHTLDFCFFTSAHP